MNLILVLSVALLSELYWSVHMIFRLIPTNQRAQLPLEIALILSSFIENTKTAMFLTQVYIILLITKKKIVC
jgi:hypothetical protein